MTREVKKSVGRALRQYSRLFVAAIFAGALSIGIMGSASAKDTIRVGHFSWPGYGFFYVAQAQKLAPNLEFEFTVIEDPVQLFSLLATNQLDVVLSTIEFGPIAAAEKMPLKLVSLTNLGYGSDHIIVHPDIKSPEQLKGERIAVLEGGLSQIYMAIWLEQQGIKWDEVEMVNLIAGDAAAAMISGQIAAAELWDPFGAQVLAELKGSRELSHSREPQWLKSALIADAVFMSDDFLQNRRALAVETTKAMFAGVEWWRANATAANDIIANAVGFSVEDVRLILGGENNPEDGTLYMYSLEEAAKFCGVAAGDPPFGQHNGQMKDHWELTNKWWINFKLMDRTVDSSEGIDCALIGEAHGG
jgi:NitT/TauT family transport system substrate-binding protein